MNDEVKKVFPPKPMVSFRSAKKLSSYLVRVKLREKGLNTELSLVRIFLYPD